MLRMMGTTGASDFKVKAKPAEALLVPAMSLALVVINLPVPWPMVTKLAGVNA